MNRRVFVFGTLVILTIMLFSIFSQQGMDDFETEFTEINRVRNENNTGPVIRVYIVTVDTLIQEEMDRYGKMMPYSKLGNTKVYFFDSAKRFPQKAKLGDVNFDASFNNLCLAKYEKRFGYEAVLLSPFK